MDWIQVKMSSFLEERKQRFSPQDKEISGLQRIEKIDFSGKIYLSEKPSKTKMILIKKNDLVISGINVAKGAMNVYYGEKDILATIHYSSYVYDKKKIDIHFLQYFLKSIEFKLLLKNQIPGGIKTEIKPKHLLPLKVFIPSRIEDQRKIAINLKQQTLKIQSLKDCINYQNQLLSKLKQSILQEAIQGKLSKKWREENPDVEPVSKLLERIKNDKEQLIADKIVKKGKKQESVNIENIKPAIPISWMFVDLDDITQFITDGTHHTPTYTDKGKVFLSAQNVKPFKFMPENHKYISEDEYKKITKNKKPEVGDLLVGRVGSKGETAVIDQDIDFAFYVSLGFVKTFKDHINPYYLSLVMNSPYGVKYATGNMSSTGSSAGNYNLGRMRSFPIPLPSLEEQNFILEKVNSLTKKCNKLEVEIKTSEANTEMLMQSVLKEAFNNQ